jgi:hypothetical protein
MLALGVGIVEFVVTRRISDAGPSSNWAAPGKRPVSYGGKGL